MVCIEAHRSETNAVYYRVCSLVRRVTYTYTSLHIPSRSHRTLPIPLPSSSLIKSLALPTTMSPIETIPPEMLTKIIEDTLTQAYLAGIDAEPESDPETSPYPALYTTHQAHILARVCRLWRQQTTETPNFWSGMEIRLEEKTSLKQELERNKAYANRSRTAPVVLLLDITEDEDYSVPAEHIEAVGTLLQRVVGRLQNVHISTCSDKTSYDVSKLLRPSMVGSPLKIFNFKNCMNVEASDAFEDETFDPLFFATLPVTVQDLSLSRAPMDLQNLSKPL